MALFVDAIANLRNRQARPRSDWSYLSLPAGSIELADGLTASYADIYRKQPWVYASVNKLAKSVGRMPLKAYARNGQRRNRLYDGELHRLTSKPYSGGTPFWLKERLVKNTSIYGNGFLVKIGVTAPDQVPEQLFPAPSIGWTVGEGDTYIWTSRSGDQYPFPRWQVMHFRFWDLDENGFGMSQLEPLRMTLAIEDAAQRLGVASFKNGARPGSVLRTDQKLKPETAQALVASLTAIHGSVDNAFKVAVLEQGLDWAPPPVTDLNDSAVIDHRKLTREEIAAVFDLPQPTIGILDEANFASIDALHTTLYQDTMGPWITMIEETFQAELVDMIPDFDDQFVEFDMNAVLRGDIGTRYRAYATAVNTGFKTVDEIRALENDPPMANIQPEAGMLRFPLNSTSGATGAQNAEDTGQEDDTDGA